MATTSAINFGSILGAQLTALIEAEIEGAEKSSEYIENVGFETAKDGTLQLRMVTFEMMRRDIDGETRKHTIAVPVLTLVPIPLLTIEEADIEFDLYVEDVVKTNEQTRPNNQPALKQSATNTSKKQLTLRQAFLAKSGDATPPPSARLMTRLAKTSRQDTKTTSDLKVKVKIAQSPFPLGIERLLNTADLSVEDTTSE